MLKFYGRQKTRMGILVTVPDAYRPVSWEVSLAEVKTKWRKET